MSDSPIYWVISNFLKTTKWWYEQDVGRCIRCTPLAIQIDGSCRKARRAMKVIRKRTSRWEARKKNLRDFYDFRTIGLKRSDFMEVIRPDIRLHVASPRHPLVSTNIPEHREFNSPAPMLLHLWSRILASTVLELLSLTSIKLNLSLTDVKFKLQYRLHYAQRKFN